MHAGSVPWYASGQAPEVTQRDPAEESPSPETSPAPSTSPSSSDHDSDHDSDPVEEDEDDNKDSSEEEEEQLAAARVAFGTKYKKTSKDKTQPVKELIWTLVDHEKLPTECARQKVGGHLGTEYPAMLINQSPGSQADDLYTVWKHLIPPEWIPKLTSTANRLLEDDPVDLNYRKTCTAEVEAILGLELAAAVSGVGNFSKCFAILQDPDSLFPPAAYGQYGITKNRALIVGRLMHLSDGPLKPAGADNHWFLDGPIDEFNDHMSRAYRGSYLGTMDESGPMWHGKEGEGDYNKSPHTAYLPRKPEPVCAEFNDICCALSRVMVRLEFEKGVAYHKDLPFVEELGSYNAAMTVRLTTPFAHQNAAVYGDSRFGIIKAAWKNWKLHKTHSVFDMKTGTSLFPRVEIIKICPKEHGSLVVMQAQIEDLNLYAIGQRRGPAVHTFLTTFGTFQKEVPKRFKHTHNLQDAPWTTVKILNTITTMQPGTDAINRQIFDLVGSQYTFPTRCFETRITKHFLLPITYVIAANASSYLFPSRYGDMQSKPLFMALAASMVRNPEWMAMHNNPGSGPGGDGGLLGAGCRSGRRYAPAEKTWQLCRIDGGPPSRESPGKHVLILLNQLEGYKGSKQQRCWECNELVSSCCPRCSSAASWLPLHPPIAQGSKKHYGCLAAHRNNPAGGYKVSSTVHTGVSSTAKRRRRIPMEVL